MQIAQQTHRIMSFIERKPKLNFLPFMQNSIWVITSTAYHFENNIIAVKHASAAWCCGVIVLFRGNKVGCSSWYDMQSQIQYNPGKMQDWTPSDITLTICHKLLCCCALYPINQQELLKKGKHLVIRRVTLTAACCQNTCSCVQTGFYLLFR